jgi:hypothetical protein
MELTAEKGTKYLIDDEDYERLKNYRVYEHFTTSGKTYFYVAKGYNKAKCALHRFIVNAPFDTMVDHINGDSCDHRRSNLRFCTQQQNMWNKSVVRSSSGFKGVARKNKCKGRNAGRKVRFYANLNYNGQHVKKYASGKIGAALKYDCLARDYFGEFACVNFPQNAEQGVDGWEKNYQFLAKKLQERTVAYTFMESKYPKGRSSFKNRFGYKGVKTKSYKTRSGKRKRKYQAELVCGGKKYNKSAKTALEAAKKYDQLARQLLKHEACLNFPNSNETGAELNNNSRCQIPETQVEPDKQAKLL